MALSGKTMFNVMLGRAARRLAEIAPGDLQISFWCNSGTEAIEGAIKLARAATGRAKIVGTLDAFHGKTLGALSVSGRESFQTPFRPLLADSVAVPFGETDGLEELLADAAAFVVEPVQGEGGVNVPPPGYLQAVREICDAHAHRVHRRRGADGARTMRLPLRVRPRRRRARRHDASEGSLRRRRFPSARSSRGRTCGIARSVRRRCCTRRPSAAASWPVPRRSPRWTCSKTRGLREQRADSRRTAACAARAQIADAYPAVVREARGLGLLVGVELTHEGYGGWHHSRDAQGAA